MFPAAESNHSHQPADPTNRRRAYPCLPAGQVRAKSVSIPRPAHYNSQGRQPMHILFERTGGFAGLKLKASLDAEALPPRQARRLKKLLQESRFFELPLRLDTPAPRPDRFQYRLTIENNNCVHTVQASEDAMPPEMRPLLDWLTATARQIR